jgi:MATE family multidrug resistance protein
MEVTAPIKDLKVTVNNKQVLSIALPITLAIIIPQINMLTNSIFLGNLSIAALGNAGITGVFYLIFAVAGNGLNNGLQSEFSRYAGADNTSAFKVILAQAIRISLQLAVAGICVTWFIAPFILKQVADPNAYPEEMNFLKIRIMGLPFLYLFQMGNAFLVASLNSRYLMIGFIAEAATNILLDYLLIYGHWGFPAMGFNGAAVASIIAEACGFLVMLLVIYKTGLKREYALLTTFRHDKKTTREIIRISTPLIAQYVISVTTWLVFFIFIEALHDQTAKAISNTMRNVFGLTGVFVWAFAGTCNVMVSNLMGQQKEDKVMGAIKRIMLWSLALCAFMCLLINIFPTVFFSLFVIRMVSCGLLIMSIANIWLNGVTGTGKTTVNLMIEIIAITGYLIYTWIFMKMHYINLTIAWSNELIYWSIIFLLSFTFLRSGRWKTKLE